MPVEEQSALRVPECVRTSQARHAKPFALPAREAMTCLHQACSADKIGFCVECGGAGYGVAASIRLSDRNILPTEYASPQYCPSHRHEGPKIKGSGLGLPSPGPGWLSSSDHLLTVSEDDAAVGKSTWEPLPNQDFRSSFRNREMFAIE
ncbi:hypothetical protein MJG53_007564 [Ovis ammon polii x Ovis aries]|uniref:Uncharacterized protein n=1 Tax=Ovis ammon polii x Ovis aries TaxID=2918886 RepID=A0ACB9V304_9CETA|nr:hypothetical protein MJG53_007564 [Ovis ammon polii x Ovis aries]